MLLLIIAGIVALIFGILFLFSPEKLRAISERANQAINRSSAMLDEKVYKLRIGIGISMLISAALIFFTIYYLVKKYG